MLRLLPLLAVLAGCAPDLPGLEGTISEAARGQPYPSLVPLDPLLAEGARPPRAAAVQAPLVARGAALERAVIAEPDTSGLAARGEALRARAAALRDAPL